MGGRRRFTLLVLVGALCIITLTTSRLEADSAKIWAGHAKEFEELLENAEVISVEELGRGANNPKRVTLRQGERTVQGLWKPIQRGPKEWAWESYETEVAAYEIDRMLGLDMVPPTIVKEIDGHKRDRFSSGSPAAGSTKTWWVTITRPSPGSDRSRACVSSTQSSATGIAARGTTWSTTSGTSS